MRPGIKRWVFLALAPFIAVGLMGGNCNKSGGGGGGWAPPSIVMTGGKGATSEGGMGGQISLTANAGDVTVSWAGLVDTLFTTLAAPEIDLGAVPWTVTQNYTLDVYTDTTDADNNAAVGDYLLFTSNQFIHRKDGTSVYTEVTGLNVNPGVTLTLGLNVSTGGAGGEDTAMIWFTGDMVIQGVVKPKTLDTGNIGGPVETIDGAPATNRDAGTVRLSAYDIINSGLVDARGADATVAGERGGYGGVIDIVSGDILYNTGKVDSSGGDGRNGGDGGFAATAYGLSAETSFSSAGGFIINRGEVRAEGGDGANGGNGGAVHFNCVYDIYNTGGIYTDGGNGSNGNGGSGGDIYGGLPLPILEGSYLYLGGVISANGGSATDAGASGPFQAGAGGMVEFNAGFKIINIAWIVSKGGDGLVNATGGDGGDLLITKYNSFSRVFQNAILQLDGGDSNAVGSSGGRGGDVDITSITGVDLAGAIYSSGGNGDLGGRGGRLRVTAGEVALLGYAHCNLDGGDGVPGGSGGQVNVSANDYSIWQPNLNASAGRGADFPGGGQGGVFSNIAFNGSITQTGSILLKGGDMTNGHGGSGGTAMLTSGLDVDLRGSIDISGGSALGPGNFAGGNPPIIQILAGRDIYCQGSFYTRGGRASGTGTGGIGGIINVWAVSVEFFGLADVRGGDGNLALGFGGDGGRIDIVSSTPPSVLTGSWYATGGTGSTKGGDGQITVDGMIVFP